jgi:tRNA-binding EMAP/Myf-like protein
MVVNLEPKMIRGIRSHGMILAVHSEGKQCLAVPSASCRPGSVVK